jgi:hypothetical protein
MLKRESSFGVSGNNCQNDQDSSGGGVTTGQIDSEFLAAENNITIRKGSSSLPNHPAEGLILHPLWRSLPILPAHDDGLDASIQENEDGDAAQKCSSTLFINPYTGLLSKEVRDCQLASSLGPLGPVTLIGL